MCVYIYTHICILFCDLNIMRIYEVDDTTLMAESEEELKSLLMKVKDEEEKT